MDRRSILKGVAALAILTAPAASWAQDTVKIGLILPMTGQQASTGKQIKAAVDLYMQENGDTVAGKKIEVILKDDGAVPDNTKRLAQELIVNDKVSVIAGFGVTPAALAVAPLATEAKVVEVVMAAGTSIITERSPYIARTSFTLPQSSVIIADWAAKNGIKKVVTHRLRLCAGRRRREIVHRALQGGRRRGRGGDQGAAGQSRFRAVPAARRRCQARCDLRVRALRPGRHLHEAVRRARPRQGRHQADRPGRRHRRRSASRHGRRRDRRGDRASLLGRSRSAKNKAYVEAFKKANNFRPNFMSVGGYDGMHLIYEALKKTGGKADGDSLIAAMKGMAWESPRGPISIDPETRDIVQNIYIRKVEKKNGELYNVEFATFEAVKDPGKVKK